MGKVWNKTNIDLSPLKRLKDGRIDWKNSVGIPFKYSIENTRYSGIVKIVEILKKPKIKVIFDNNEPVIMTRESFLKAWFYNYLDKKVRIYKFAVNEIVLNSIVIEQKIIKRNKSHLTGYRLKCLKDNYEYDISESDLKEAIKRGTTRCPVCSNDIIIDGINSFYDSSPELEEWFVDKELIHKIPRYSSIHEIELMCPICGNHFTMYPSQIHAKPTCSCSTYASYPEKVFAGVLTELDVPYIFQLTKRHFAWCEKYRFDFYFEYKSQKYIFELDGGLGHGNNSFKSNDDKEYSLLRDKEKDIIAKENSIELIRIDVNYNNMEKRFDFIKNNICNSKLSELFSLDNIDWGKIELFTEKSYLQLFLNDYNLGFSVSEIAKKYNISKSTVRKYLKKGAILNLCDYDSSKGYDNYVKNHYKPENHPRLKFVKVVYNNNIYIIKGICNVSKELKAITGISVSNKQIQDLLYFKLNKTKYNISISYATENEYLDYISKAS